MPAFGNGGGSIAGASTSTGATGSVIGADRFALRYAEASAGVHVASARSQPSGASAGGLMIQTSSAPAASRRGANLAIASRPGASASGHRITLRFAIGDQSALSIALQPLGHVAQLICGNNACAASVAFSPSQINTGPSVWPFAQ